MRCFWAHPENYDHVAGKPEKIVSLIFTGDEIEDYNKFVALSGEESAQKVIKEMIHKYIR